MSGNQTFTVIVVDTEQPARDFVGRELTRLGYECSAAASPEEALRLIERETVDLVVMDPGMPGTNGFTILRRMREIDPDIAVVAITEHGTMESAVEAMKLGAADCLTKPVEGNRLALSARSALEKRRLDIESRKYRENLERMVEERTRRLDRTNRSLEDNLLETIRTFLGLLEKRDASVGSHSKRVAATCRGICTKLDLRDTVRTNIEIAALLHDIGKIGIQDSILQKTANFFGMSSLTEEEKQTVRLHPVIGQESVEMIETLNPVSRIIRHHHELFNGSGYPDHLSGYNIPLGSRIITVVDAYDRVVYSVEARKREAAKRIIRMSLAKNAGILYDPDVVDVFLEYSEEQEKADLARRERAIGVADIKPGMILSRDIVTAEGVPLVSQNEAVSSTDYIRIMRFRQRKSLPETVFVYESSLADLPAEDASASAPTMPAPPSGDTPQTEINREEILRFRRVRNAIDATTGLSTLPILYESAVALLDDPTSTRKDIADVIRRDPTIVTKVLRLVNSPLFALSRRITTIEDAIPLLGFSEIRNIVTSVSVLSMFGAGNGSEAFDRTAFWKHSAATAIACKILARKLKVADEEEYFTAALLHDIGKRALDELFPNDFRTVIAMTAEQSVSMRQAERTVFGRPHTAVGDYLLRKWKIPDVLTDAVLHHHSPRESTADPFLVSAVHVSDIIVHILNLGSSGEHRIPEPDDFACRQLGIGNTDLEIFAPEIEEHILQSDDLLSLGERE